MVNLIWECRTHEYKTVKDVQALSELYMNRIVAKCEGAVATFLECKNICTSKQLMKDSVAERVTQDELCKAIKVNREIFLDQLAGLHPHPIFVDLRTETVLMGSKEKVSRST